MNVADDHRDFVTNEAELARLRKKFETAVGPVSNVGGIR